MSDLDDFRTETLARQAEVIEASLLGDPAPWSTRYPGTLFGAWGPCKTGWDELNRIFRWVATRFSDVSDFGFDVGVADISGDLAYATGYERFTGSVDGGPIAPITTRSRTSTIARTTTGRSYTATATSRQRMRARRGRFRAGTSEEFLVSRTTDRATL